jgi:hypothetical protein
VLDDHHARLRQEDAKQEPNEISQFPIHEQHAPDPA